jgi:hypothetical protein
MAKVHWVLQGKGGVGKSLVASLLAQYKFSLGQVPLCIDTDPINATFERFKSLFVRRLSILKGDVIDPRRFDELIEWIAASSRDVVIDSGSSVFVPLMHYLTQNQVFPLLQQLGYEPVVHTVLTGGQALTDTLGGFEQLLRQFPNEGRFVVWLNPYWGPVEERGRAFQQWPVYTAARSRIAAVVALPELAPETSGLDFREMLRAHLTFDEALAQSALSLMARQRLKLTREQFFSAIGDALPALLEPRRAPGPVGSRTSGGLADAT